MCRSYLATGLFGSRKTTSSRNKEEDEGVFAGMTVDGKASPPSPAAAAVSNTADMEGKPKEAVVTNGAATSTPITDGAGATTAPVQKSNGPSFVAPTLETYKFPADRIKRQKVEGKTPLVLVACGSFSPLTYLHLRMFEMAADFARLTTKYEVVGGFFSPVSDGYGKKGLALAKHRIEMCTLVAGQISGWLSCDPWEAIQTSYVPTALVLDHFNKEINETFGGIEDVNGNRRPAHIALLAGADVLQSMSVPNLWSPKDLDHILKDYGMFVLERTGTNIEEALCGVEKYRQYIHVIPQPIPNDVSSTGIRAMLKDNQSLRYLTPDPIIEYIQSHNLYRDV